MNDKPKLREALEATERLDTKRFFRLAEKTDEWKRPDPITRVESADDAIAAIIPDIMKFPWVETSEGNFEAPVHNGTAIIRIGQYKNSKVQTVLQLGCLYG